MSGFDVDVDQIGWGEPSHLTRYHSPYYNESHVKWRMHLRKWCEEKLQPNIPKWEQEKVIPHSVFRDAFRVGFLPAIVGAPWPEELCGPCPGLAPGRRPTPSNPSPTPTAKLFARADRGTRLSDLHKC